MKRALTIAGSDPSGGAGLQADLKTFQRHGAYGMAVVTLLTVQNTRRVSRVEVMSPDLVVEQLDAVLDDLPPDAAKTGALGSAAVVEAFAARWAGTRVPLVVDPVMISKHGDVLLDEAARTAIIEKLLPLATLVTPNAHEAAVLAGMKVETLADAEVAARRIGELGPKAVLVKGARFGGLQATDVLWMGDELMRLSSPLIETRHTHGTGCTLSAAITAFLAHGESVPDAVQQAKDWLSEALRTAPRLGGGIGPVSHFA